MKDSEPKIELFSHREWHHKNIKNLVAIQFYHWVNRIQIIDESDGRTAKGETTVEGLEKEWNDWTLVKDWTYEK